MQPVDDFYQAAKEFCKFMQENEICGHSSSRLLTMLMKLYSAALELPDIEPETENSIENNTRTRYDIKVNEDFPTGYWMIFDPLHDEAPVCGDLLDDLESIAQDLHDGISEYDAGKIGNAVFEWKWGVDNHWGLHAVCAIRALHAIRIN